MYEPHQITEVVKQQDKMGKALGNSELKRQKESYIGSQKIRTLKVDSRKKTEREREKGANCKKHRERKRKSKRKRAKDDSQK